MTDETQPEKRSLAEEFLDQAIDSLRDAGSAETLYPENARTSSNKITQAAGRVTAIGRRTKHSRTSMLFSAFAAEAFVNQFLHDNLASGADLRAVDRLPTIEKYVLGTRLAIGGEIFDRGADPIQTIAALFKVRDSLVHSRPLAREERENVFDNPPEYAATNPPAAARAIVEVASAAATLNDRSALQRVSYHVVSVVAGSKTFLDFGNKAHSRLPNPNDPAAPDLAISAMEAVTGKKLRRRFPDEPR